MTNPIAYALSKVAWGYFGTLTYSGLKPEYVRKSMTMAFFYEIARMQKVRPRELVWVLREERGEIGGRLHHHFLLQETKDKTSLSMCFMLDATWKKIGGGMTAMRQYDRQLTGADYVTKCLSGANAYEMGKFNDSVCQLTYSHRLVSILKRMRQDARTMSRADCAKSLKTMGQVGVPVSPCEKIT